MVKVCVDCSICIALFIVQQREPREASKLIDVAHNYKIKCDKVYILISKLLNNSYLSEKWQVNKIMRFDSKDSKDSIGYLSEYIYIYI